MADMTFELIQAQVRVLSFSQSGSMDTKDVGDFQGIAPHDADLGGWQNLQRTDHLAQDLGGHVRVHRRVANLWRNVCIDTRLLM